MEKHMDLVKLRTAMNKDLHAAVNKVVETYRRETGVTPSSINVKMIDVRAYGDEVAQFLCSGVDIEFRF